VFPKQQPQSSASDAQKQQPTVSASTSTNLQRPLPLLLSSVLPVLPSQPTVSSASLPASNPGPGANTQLPSPIDAPPLPFLRVPFQQPLSVQVPVPTTTIPAHQAAPHQPLPLQSAPSIQVAPATSVPLQSTQTAPSPTTELLASYQPIPLQLGSTLQSKQATSIFQTAVVSLEPSPPLKDSTAALAATEPPSVSSHLISAVPSEWLEDSWSTSLSGVCRYLSLP
jgi:hypothetical protein